LGQDRDGSIAILSWRSCGRLQFLANDEGPRDAKQGQIADESWDRPEMANGTAPLGVRNWRTLLTTNRLAL
jgi:hypothetical protein